MGTHVWNKAGLDSDVLDPVGVQVIVIPCGLSMYQLNL